MTLDPQPDQPVTPEQDLLRRAERIRTEMGGSDKIARVHARGAHTVRERIDALVDAGSFRELGTFAHSQRVEDRAETPGDGKVGGRATIDGRPVVLYGDDVTVRQGSSAVVGMRKTRRLEELAIRMGCPLIDLGETGGGRIPDILGARGITNVSTARDKGQRRRRVPTATVIVGRSFGGSSVQSARGDLTVQVRGSCLAITSPRVFEVAIGETIGFEELGGVDVHAELTGQIDLAVDTEDEAWAAVRRWLSYLPSNAWSDPPRSPDHPAPAWDPGLVAGWHGDRVHRDVRRLLDHVIDVGSMFELRPRIGRSLVTALARLDGWPVGVIATDPSCDDGAIGADGCEKAVRLLALCDAFQLPVLSFIDSPGYGGVGSATSKRLLARSTRLRQALTLATCPRVAIIVGRASGLAFASPATAGWGPDGCYAWPTAELDAATPSPGADGVTDSARSAYDAAGLLRLDEIMHPADTRTVLADDLARLASRNRPPAEKRLLSYWSTC